MAQAFSKKKFKPLIFIRLILVGLTLLFRQHGRIRTVFNIPIPETYIFKGNLSTNSYAKMLKELQTPMIPGAALFGLKLIGDIVKKRRTLYENMINKPITEPKVDYLVHPSSPGAGKDKATILSLVRNQDAAKRVKPIKRI